MKHVYRIIVIVFVLIFLLFLFRRPSSPITTPREEVWMVMGTVASLRTPAKEREHFSDMLEIARETFSDVNQKLSVYDPESELSILHQEGELDSMSPLTRTFLETTKEMTAKAEGYFDATLLPVIQLWGFSGGDTPTNVPSADEIADALDRPLLSSLQIEDTKAYFDGPPAHIDPGGIAKGLALDLAFENIQQAFPEAHFLLNLGGEMRASGMAEEDRPWRIAIQHPFEERAIIGVISLPDTTAVATSGHYERYTEIDGKRYAHIINPATGWPVEDTAGVTVLSPNSTEADVLSTGLFVAGLDGAADLLATFPQSEAIIIPDRQPIEIYTTDGLKEHFDPYPDVKDHLHPLPNSH